MLYLISLSATFRLPYLIFLFWSFYAHLTAIIVQTMQIATKIPYTIQYIAPHFLIPTIESTFLEPIIRFIKISAVSKKKQRPCLAHWKWDYSSVKLRLSLRTSFLL